MNALQSTSPPSSPKIPPTNTLRSLTALKPRLRAQTLRAGRAESQGVHILTSFILLVGAIGADKLRVAMLRVHGGEVEEG